MYIKDIQYIYIHISYTIIIKLYNMNIYNMTISIIVHRYTSRLSLQGRRLLDAGDHLLVIWGFLPCVKECLTISMYNIDRSIHVCMHSLYYIMYKYIYNVYIYIYVYYTCKVNYIYICIIWSHTENFYHCHFMRSTTSGHWLKTRTSHGPLTKVAKRWTWAKLR